MPNATTSATPGRMPMKNLATNTGVTRTLNTPPSTTGTATHVHGRRSRNDSGDLGSARTARNVTKTPIAPSTQ